MLFFSLYPVLLLMVLSGALEENPRQTIDLSGIWDITVDEQDQGSSAGWFRNDMAASDTIAWQPIFVPSTWETALGTNFDGVAWYMKEARIPSTAEGRRVWLCFHGAATDARVWVNGQEAGRHLGAWTAFSLDITDHVTPGEEALIVVRLDEKVGHNTQGFLPIIAPHFGGIWQKVELIITHPVRIDDLALRIDASKLVFDPNDISDSESASGSKSASGSISKTNDPSMKDKTGDDQTATEQKAELCSAELTVDVPILGPPEPGASVRMTLFRNEVPLPKASSTKIVEQEDGTTRARLTWKGEVLPWDVGQPNLYALRIELLDREQRVLDELIRYTGFRNVQAQGKKIVLNGKPLSVRGFLTWGHYPPMLAPMPPRAEFLEQLSYLHACGFNTIKFCLWLPPADYLDMVDATGMLAWIEYPTWHPKLDAAHKDDLLREYGEMALHDHHHPCVILRSITCKTGPSADLSVLQALYDLVKAHAPGTLVEDDSSWIQWNRIHDFWDDHSYGNNRMWRDKLRALEEHRKEHGIKPLLLGEAIAADTWVDSSAFNLSAGGERPWWWPNWLDDQIAFEEKLRARFAGRGFDVVEDVRLASLVYALEMRRWQIETFRDQMPHAGYVVSVIRDVRLCAMGLLDYFSKPKWLAEA